MLFSASCKSLFLSNNLFKHHIRSSATIWRAGKLSLIHSWRTSNPLPLWQGLGAQAIQFAAGEFTQSICANKCFTNGAIVCLRNIYYLFSLFITYNSPKQILNCIVSLQVRNKNPYLPKSNVLGRRTNINNNRFCFFPQRLKSYSYWYLEFNCVTKLYFYSNDQNTFNQLENLRFCQ